MMSRLHLAAARRPSGPLQSGRVIRTVVTGAAALALAACGTLSSAACAGPGAGHGTALASASASAPAPAPAPRASARTAAPRFFADLVQGELGDQSPLQVRESSTGRLVAQDLQVQANGLAALANGRTFVVAEQVGTSCFTRLYRLRLNGRGQPGRPIPLPVPRLRGVLFSLVASGTGNVLGYAASGCSKGERGFIGVVHVRSGRTVRWGHIDLGGESPGNVGLNGALSMSSNGRLLAFPAFTLSADSTVTGQDVRVLPVDAPPGTVAQRSRIVRAGPYPPAHPLLASAVLSLSGRTLYTCTSLAPSGHAVRLSADRSSSGRLRRTLATLTVPGSARSAEGYCPIALDGQGRQLLVPYAIRYPRNPGAAPQLRIARMAISTGRVTVLTVRLPAGGMQPATGLLIAW
jgi:hypothetical protein